MNTVLPFSLGCTEKFIVEICVWIYNSSSSWLRFKTAHSLKTFLPRPPFLFSRRADRRRLRQRKNVNLLVNLLVLVLVNLLVFLVTMPVLSLIVVLVCLTICSKHSNKSIFQCGNQSVNKSVSIAMELPGQQFNSLPLGKAITIPSMYLRVDPFPPSAILTLNNFSKLPWKTWIVKLS